MQWDIDEVKGELCGPAALPMTPFNQDFSLNLDALRGNIQYMLDGGLATGRGFIICPCGTGEYVSLSPDESRSMVETALEVCGDRMPVVGGVASLNLDDVVSTGRRLVEAGARYLMIPPPCYYPMEGGLAVRVVPHPGRVARRRDHDLRPILARGRGHQAHASTDRAIGRSAQHRFAEVRKRPNPGGDGGSPAALRGPLRIRGQLARLHVGARPHARRHELHFRPRHLLARIRARILPLAGRRRLRGGGTLARAPGALLRPLPRRGRDWAWADCSTRRSSRLRWSTWGSTAGRRGRLSAPPTPKRKRPSTRLSTRSEQRSRSAA